MADVPTEHADDLGRDARRVDQSLQDHAKPVLATAKLLFELKGKWGSYGLWRPLLERTKFKGDSGQRMAQSYLVIARCPPLMNSKNSSHLPGAVSALVELTKLPHDILQQEIDRPASSISPAMTAEQAAQLVVDLQPSEPKPEVPCAGVQAKYHLRVSDCVEMVKQLPDHSVNLVVTSPPYDAMRDYENGNTFDFQALAHELTRVLTPGGSIVWVIGDQTLNGTETGTRLRQALYFKEKCGLHLTTLYWNRGSTNAVGHLRVRYAPVVDPVFVLSKGGPRIFNPIRIKPNRNAGRTIKGKIRNTDASFVQSSSFGRKIAAVGALQNLLTIAPEGRRDHPAAFPLRLAAYLILTHSERGDVVLDPFSGSGTTVAAALALGRHCIGSDISEQYVKKSLRRIEVNGNGRPAELEEIAISKPTIKRIRSQVVLAAEAERQREAKALTEAATGSLVDATRTDAPAA